ncbi:HNH endonuclease [Ulvibacterium marinum]|uniref:HNH endonuclease n=1 Tax=Ulvibacterium marinum TaxID=2419782 RepID=A0A3B0C8W8_9FLAO|nr:HNH endonuclease [Ulvibacterium marinum]RKN81211.1 HNH endonuclease [Ulvibacterium marinum]
MANKNWTREEHILAFNLYCKIPLSKINSTYPAVKELAQILDRSDGSVAMKLANFMRHDPALKARNVSGLKRGAKGEELIWHEFHGNWEELAWQSEQILASKKIDSIENSSGIDLLDLPKEGKERETIIKTRVNQSFFRKTILASYTESCCVTGIAIPQLLVASHIIPWSVALKERMNPSNGLCLNTLHDKAFDDGLITVTPDYKIRLSKIVLDNVDNQTEKFFLPYKNAKIKLPQRFYPDAKFLEWHNQNIFKG